MTQKAREMLQGYRGVSLAGSDPASVNRRISEGFSGCSAPRESFLDHGGGCTLQKPRRRERAPAGGPRLLRLSLCTHQQRTRKLRLPESPDLRKELATQTQAGTELSSGRRSRGLARWARGSQREGTPRFCRIQRGHAVPASAPAVWPDVHLGLAHLAALAHPIVEHNCRACFRWRGTCFSRLVYIHQYLIHAEAGRLYVSMNMHHCRVCFDSMD